MKNDRPGEHLWEEWIGEYYDPTTDTEIIYYTSGHVDVSHDIVKRALASALQRDGVAYSLADGYHKADVSLVLYGYSGQIEDEEEILHFCDEEGSTKYGEVVFEPLPTTWVEIQ